MKSRYLLIGVVATAFLLLVHLFVIDDYTINWDFHHVFFAGLHHLRHPTNSEMINLPFSDPDPRRMILTPFGPLQSALPAASYVAFYEKLKLLPFDSAFNLPAIIFGVGGVLVLFLFLLETRGVLTATIGAAFLALYPRYIGDLHTNVKDIPTAAAFAATLWFLWRLANHRRLSDLIAASLGFAITFNFKVNAISIPVIFGVWLIWLAVSRAKAHLARPIARFKSGMFDAPLLFFLLAPLLMFAIWSLFWDEPLKQLIYLLGFFRDNTQNLEVLYWGRWYCSAVNVPWHYPFGYLAAVTPLGVLAAFLIGFVVLLRRLLKHDPLASFLLLWFLVPIARYLSPKIGVIDGIRHFEEVVFPLSAIAAIGLTSLLMFINRRVIKKFRQAQKLLLTIGAIGMLIYLLVPVVRLHPYQLSYFNELVGGASGAMGRFDLDYWGISQKQAIAWLNTNAPPDSIIHIVMSADTAGKYLRPDLRKRLNTTWYDQADYVVVLNRQSFFYRYFYIVEYMLRRKTAYVVERGGVPLTWVFDNRMGQFPREREWWHGESTCIRKYWDTPTP